MGLAISGYTQESLDLAAKGREHSGHPDSYFRDLASLLAVAGRLENLERILAVAGEIEFEKDRCSVLTGLALRLVHLGRAEEALSVTRKITTRDNRAEVLDALGRLCVTRVQQDPAAACNLWQQILHILATHSRQELLASLFFLSPALFALGGAEAMQETIRAIQDVGRWWP